MKCKKCEREFRKRRAGQVFCTQDCRVNHYRGTRSKWQKITQVLEDEQALLALGVCIKRNSDG